MSRPWAIDLSNISRDLETRAKTLAIEPFGMVEAKYSEIVRKIRNDTTKFLNRMTKQQTPNKVTK